MEESTKTLIESVKNVLRAAFPGRNFYAVFAVSDEDTHEYGTSELTACSCSSYVEDAAERLRDGASHLRGAGACGKASQGCLP